MANNHFPWKTGYNRALFLMAAFGLIVGACALLIDNKYPDSLQSIALLLFGLSFAFSALVLKSACTLADAFVSRHLVSSGFTSYKDALYNANGWPEDPLISLSCEGKYYSRYNDEVFTVSQTHIVFGVYIYKFQTPAKSEDDLYVVYSRYSPSGQKLRAYKFVAQN